MDTLITVVLIAFFIVGLVLLGLFQKRNVTFTKRVLIGLGLGITFGFIIHLVFGVDSDITKTVVDWTSIVGSGYISFLSLLIIPLVFVAIVSAFTRLTSFKNLRKISAATFTTLLSTTAFAALIGYLSVLLFSLAGAAFTQGTTETTKIEALAKKQETLSNLTVPQQITSFIPKNVFEDFAGLRSTSTIGVVIFAVLVGIAYLSIRKTLNEKPNTKMQDDVDFFARFISSLHTIVMKIVKMVILLTPYGVFALITKVLSTTDFIALVNLIQFVAASYFAIIVVFILHLIILLFFKISPLQYIKNAWSVLSFAFFSRSSAASLPLNVEAQKEKFGVDEVSASFSASFGISVGQNGCAGVYPAMLATIIAPTAGINVYSWQFVLSLIAIVTVSSFGVAGVGGGATFASLIVLGTLGLPVAIIGLVISVEPLIDMARTALNVSDAMVAGIVSSRVVSKTTN